MVSLIPAQEDIESRGGELKINTNRDSFFFKFASANKRKNANLR